MKIEDHAQKIRRNIDIHDRIARKYETIHGEIFNDVEQRRLRAALERAVLEVRTDRRPVRALDFGCGSGNLTSHLLALGAEVTAADVSVGCLDLVRDRYGDRGLRTHRLNGRDLSEFDDQAFDLVATYSVLHHIPDYIAACTEMARVCRVGGVVVIDHEASPNVWQDNQELRRFWREASRVDWRKYLRPLNYVHRIRRLFDPRFANEGDIHVWPDDHIEWEAIIQAMAEGRCEVIVTEDYLLCRRLYRPEVYDRESGRLADTRVMMFRKAQA
jgi:ubiquinone/menaquinone biosynthesis C-methylase UbiE